MSDSENYRRDVAGRFMQAVRNSTFSLAHRLFPDGAAQITEIAEREVEEAGLLVEGIDVIRHWFRSDSDAEWLDKFWQSPDGRRFLDLNAELVLRADLRRHHPEVPLPPPGETT